MISGVDVSELQGVIDWKAVADADIRFAYLRSSLADAGTDKRFPEYRAGADKAGLLIGAYHVACWRNPQTEARWTWAACGQLGYSQFQLPPAVDFEVAPPHGWGRGQAMAWLKSYLETLADLCQRRPVVYTYPSFFAQWGDPTAEWLKDYPLWIAHYKHTGAYVPAASDEPTVPKPWDTWKLHQYSGNGGLRVPGVKVDCDRDRFNGSWEDLLDQLAGDGDSALEPTVISLPPDECNEKDPQ